MLPLHLISVDAMSLWFQNHMEVAGIIIILLIAGESVPLVGLVIPGTVLMVTVLGLLGLGVVDFWTLFWWLTLGAVLGDSIGYHLGLRYAEPMQRWMTDHLPGKLAKTSNKKNRPAAGGGPAGKARHVGNRPEPVHPGAAGVCADVGGGGQDAMAEVLCGQRDFGRDLGGAAPGGG